jgi:hypothetical protein
MYRYAGPDFRSGWPYYSFPGLSIACIIYSFVIAGLGFVVFKRPNITLTIAVSLLNKI